MEPITLPPRLWALILACCLCILLNRGAWAEERGRARSPVPESAPESSLDSRLAQAGDEEAGGGGEIIFDDGEEIVFPDDGGEDEFFFDDEDGEKKYPSRSLLYQPSADGWLGEVNLGGYFENEVGVDTVQDNANEDMIDFRSKLYGYGSYKFSKRSSVHLSALAYYWLLEGGNDRQRDSVELYEGYLKLHFSKADLYAGQMLARFGACDLFSPTNGVNPINYRIFVDPDTEDLRIPLPMFRADLFHEGFALETIYVPVFRSAIVELGGSDLSLFQARDEEDGEALGVDPAFRQTLDRFVGNEIDFEEQQLYMGEVAVRLSRRSGGSRTELVYFSTREDLPIFLYQEAKELNTDEDEEPVLPTPENLTGLSGDIKLAYDRYELYGLAYSGHFHGLDVFFEYAYSPERSMFRALNTDDDEYIDRTRRVRVPWQAVAIEVDYLAPGGEYLIKVGAQKQNYFDPPDDVVLQGGESLYFLLYLRYYALNRTLVPEARFINLQGTGNNWYISPRIEYKWRDRYIFVGGLNIYTGSGNPIGYAARDFVPIAVVSDNNQVFFSVRRLF